MKKVIEKKEAMGRAVFLVEKEIKAEIQTRKFQPIRLHHQPGNCYLPSCLLRVIIIIIRITVFLLWQ